MPFIVAALVVLVLVAIGAIRRPAVLRIAGRDFLRRKGQSALVVSGLLIASLVIAAALVAGDAQEKMFLENIYRAWGPVDLTAGSVSGAPIDEKHARGIVQDPRVVGLTDGASVRIQLPAAVEAKEQGTRETFVNLIGVPKDLDPSLGEFYPVEGSGSASGSEPTVLINERLASRLNARAGETLTFSALGLDGKPAAFSIKVGAVVRGRGKADLNSRPNAFMSLEALQTATGGEGLVTQIVVSARGSDRDPQRVKELEKAIIASSKAQAAATPGSIHYVQRISGSKLRTLEGAREQSEFLRTILAALGGIVALTSIALIINLFVMLGEERRAELGTMRALGLKRGGLVLLGMTEGVLYAGTAAIIGAGIGGFFGRYLGETMTSIFQTFASEGASFAFTEVPFEINLSTLLTAASAGFLISVVTVLGVSFRTSRLSVVAAIRGLPETRRRHRRLPVFQAILLLVGGFLSALGAGNSQPYPTFVGGILIVVALGSLAGRYFPARLTSSVAALTMIGWGLYAYVFLPDFGGDIQESFSLVTFAAVVIVLAAVVLISTNLTVFERLAALFSPRIRAVVRVATGYPVGYRLRTGLSMAMFGLILYMVAAFAIWGGFAGGNYEEQSGGFEVLARSTVPIERLSVDGASSIVPMYRARYDQGYKVGSGQEFRFPVQLFGVDESMAKKPLKLSDRVEGKTYEEVWKLLATSSDGALLDTATTPGGVEPGSILFLRTDAGVRQFKVLGIVDEFWMGGIFISKKAFSEMYPVRTGDNAWLVSADGVATQKLIGQIERTHAASGMDAQSIQAIFEESSSAQRTFVGLFQLLLKLGLLIGVSSLAIGSVRTVLERRQAIGVLRALGFKKEMVGTSLLLESLLVATLGCGVGILIGLPGTFLLVGQQLPEVSFSADWGQIISTLAIVYGAVLIFTAIPAWRASRLTPAEAVRYVE